MCRSEVLDSLSGLNHQFRMQIYSNADFINRSHLISESFINVRLIRRCFLFSGLIFERGCARPPAEIQMTVTPVS